MVIIQIYFTCKKVKTVNLKKAKILPNYNFKRKKKQVSLKKPSSLRKSQYFRV